MQTERDKARVVEGLLGAGLAGDSLDRSQLEALLANLSARVFLMRNVHEDAPVLFRTRWSLSYLRGPLTLTEIARLTPPRTLAASIAARTPGSPTGAPAVNADSASTPTGPTKPVVPAGIPELYRQTAIDAPRLVARLLAIARLHFVDNAAGIDTWQTRSWLAPVDEHGVPDWSQADLGGDVADEFSPTAPARAAYAAAPAAVLRPANYAAWGRTLTSHLYETATLAVFRCDAASALTAIAADEREFRAKLAYALREQRDANVDKLRRKYGARLATLEDQLRRTDERIERERSQLSQLSQQQMQTAISVGTSILGALLGRKRISVANAGRVGAAARNAGRIGREGNDVARAQESRDVLEQRLASLRNELQQDVAALEREFDPQTTAIARIELRPRKAEINVTTLALAWTPER